jgi:uncharacterized protein (TIGR03000 family)
MYSVVLMAALTTGMDLPDRGGCRGGGCHGGGRHGCCGCYGGCYGGYGYGCMGYGGGCYGGYGCMGMGYGGCMGYGGGYGCMGMGYGGGCMGYGGGCYGGGYGGGCYGGGYGGFGYGGGVIMGGTTVQPAGEKAPQPKAKNRDESLLPAPATILVSLPTDAKLLIDNEATTSSGASRVFQSPTLNPGKEYQYTLSAEVVRDGKHVKAEQVVTVKAGQTTPVTLTLPTPGIAQR